MQLDRLQVPEAPYYSKIPFIISFDVWRHISCILVGGLVEVMVTSCLVPPERRGIQWVYNPAPELSRWR